MIRLLNSPSKPFLTQFIRGSSAVTPRFLGNRSMPKTINANDLLKAPPSPDLLEKKKALSVKIASLEYRKSKLEEEIRACSKALGTHNGELYDLMTPIRDFAYQTSFQLSKNQKAFIENLINRIFYFTVHGYKKIELFQKGSRDIDGIDQNFMNMLTTCLDLYNIEIILIKETYGILEGMYDQYIWYAYLPEKISDISLDLSSIPEKGIGEALKIIHVKMSETIKKINDHTAKDFTILKEALVDVNQDSEFIEYKPYAPALTQLRAYIKEIGSDVKITEANGYVMAEKINPKPKTKM